VKKKKPKPIAKKKTTAKVKAPTQSQLRKEWKEVENRVCAFRAAMGLPRPAFPYPAEGMEVYLLTEPNRCPFCGSEEISAIGWDGGPYDTNCIVECDDCNSTWKEFYHLKGAGYFQKGNKSNDETKPEPKAIDPEAIPDPEPAAGWVDPEQETHEDVPF
jgi:hypothetical protein